MNVSRNYRYSGKNWGGVNNGKREVARRLKQIGKGMLRPVHMPAIKPEAG